jgi:tetratricopeptide (TPR) repeat protein
MKYLQLFLLFFFSLPSFAETEKHNFITESPPAINELLRRSVHGNFLAGRTATILRDTGAASVYWRAAFRQEPRNAVLLERAFISSLGDGSIEEAFPLAERIITLDKTHRLARVVLAVKSARVYQYNAAKLQLNAIAKGQIDLTTLLLTAWTQQGQGETKEAIKSLDRLAQSEAYKAFREYHSGLILDVSDEKPAAGVRLEEANKLDPGVLRMADAYARWLSQNKSKEDVLKVYTDFGQYVPAHPVVVEAKRALDAGFKLLPTVTNAPQGMAEVLYGLGVALARNQGEEIAAVYLQLALYLDPNHDLATIALADVFEQSKNYIKSVALYRTIKNASPLKTLANIQIAYDLEASAKLDEAKTHLENLLRDKPADLEIIQALGNLQRTRKDYKAAAEVYTRAVDLIAAPDEKNWSLFYFRGMAYERSKNWQAAEKDLLKALDLVPKGSSAGRAQILNYLGYSWVDLGMNIEKGLDMIKEALRLTPNDGYITDSLGWAYYRLNRIPEAVIELERAVELKPDDPTLNDHLGDAYWYGGRRLEAGFKWQHALDLKPEADELPKIQAKQKNGLPEVKSEK